MIGPGTNPVAVTLSSPTEAGRIIAVGPLNLHVVEAGPVDGPLLILLHGFPEGWRAWSKLMSPLADEGFRVVAPDLRGYGASDAPAGIDAYRLDQLTDDIIGLADVLGAERFCLGGHDWGGIIAWSVAAHHPDRVRRLITMAAPHRDTWAAEMRRQPCQLLRSAYIGLFQLPRLPEIVLRGFHYRLLRRSMLHTSRPGTFSARELDLYAAEWARPGRLTAMLNYYRALRHPTPRLRRISTPTLILFGGKDRFLEPHFATAAVGMCDDAKLVVLPHAGHWFHHEEAGRVMAEIIEFLGEDG